MDLRLTASKISIPVLILLRYGSPVSNIAPLADSIKVQLSLITAVVVVVVLLVVVIGGSGGTDPVTSSVISHK